jgi:hypothetical protein
MPYAWIDQGDGRKVFRRVDDHRPKRARLACPHVVSDTMDPVQSMLDGKLYDSKARLRQTYKQAGMIEVGNDPARLRPKDRPKLDKKAIRQSIEKAEARYSRGERAILA